MADFIDYIPEEKAPETKPSNVSVDFAPTPEITEPVNETVEKLSLQEPN